MLLKHLFPCLLVLLFAVNTSYCQQKQVEKTQNSTSYSIEQRPHVVTVAIPMKLAAQAVRRGKPLQPTEIANLQVVDVCSYETFTKMLTIREPSYTEVNLDAIIPSSFIHPVTKLLCITCGHNFVYDCEGLSVDDPCTTTLEPEFCCFP